MEEFQLSVELSVFLEEFVFVFQELVILDVEIGCEMVGVEVLESVFQEIELYFCYLNCEFSWLWFNSWVLEEVFDEFYLLLECVKFLVIYVLNFDEFFMICVLGL